MLRTHDSGNRISRAKPLRDGRATTIDATDRSHLQSKVAGKGMSRVGGPTVDLGWASTLRFGQRPYIFREMLAGR